MSTERVQYETTPIGPRLIAFVIDYVVVVILAVIFQLLGSLEWEILWKPYIFVGVEYSEVFIIAFIFMDIFSILVYFIFVPGLTDGQTIGKLIMGLHVVYDDNSSTKRKFRTHTKRLFLMRQGTKVVKVVDEQPEGF